MQFRFTFDTAADFINFRFELMNMSQDVVGNDGRPSSEVVIVGEDAVDDIVNKRGKMVKWNLGKVTEGDQSGDFFFWNGFFLALENVFF